MAKRRNWVAEAIATVGSVEEAATAIGLRVATLYDYRRAGFMRIAAPLLRLARLAAPRLKVDELTLARKLAGLE